MTQAGRFDRIDSSIESLGERLTRYILDLRDETRAGMQALNSRKDILSSTMTSIDLRIRTLTKSVIEAGVADAEPFPPMA